MNKHITKPNRSLLKNALLLLFILLIKTSSVFSQCALAGMQPNTTGPGSAPPSTSIINTKTPTLRWDSIPQAGIVYGVYVWDMNTRMRVVDNNCATRNCSYTILPGVLSDTTQYMWAVKAFAGCSDPCMTILSQDLFFEIQPKVIEQIKPLQEVKKKYKYNCYFQGGVLFHNNYTGSVAEFKTLSPNSVLLKNNLSRFTKNDSNLTGSAGMWSGGIAFRKVMPEKMFKPYTEYRIGLTYYRSGNGFKNAYTSKTDSVHNVNYYYGYETKECRVDFAVLHGYHVTPKYTIYGGLGASAGFVYNAFTSILYSDSSFVKTEKFNNKTGAFNFSMYAPLGLDIRMGERTTFWSHLHFCIEARPTLSFYTIPEIKTTANEGLYIGVGLRFSLDVKKEEIFIKG